MRTHGYPTASEVEDLSGNGRSGNRRRLARTFGFWLLSLAALALVSCASLDATSTQYVGAPHPPATDPGKVEILRTEPTRAHDRLGEIMVDASTDPAPPVAQVEERLRKEAGKLGADAVVIVYDRVQPVGVFVSGTWWNRSASTVTGHKLVGVAIKYRP
jgi:hypothetical protein